MCVGLAVLEAGIRQCPSVELWCHNSLQYMKWIFSQPLIHVLCGQAVVGCEFVCLFRKGLRALNKFTTLNVGVELLWYNFNLSAHNLTSPQFPPIHVTAIVNLHSHFCRTPFSFLTTCTFVTFRLCT